MLNPMDRVATFGRRFARALERGFIFRGTRFTNLPERLWLLGRWVELRYPSDQTILSDVINVILEDEYGLLELKKPIRTIVDIGANVGLFSIWARHCFPSAKILAFEPNPFVFEFAEGNTKDMAIMLFAEAVAAESGSADILLSGSSRTARVAKKAEGPLKIVSFDEVLERSGGEIDLLKMDCEGGEWDIFKSVKAFQNVAYVAMEYHLDSQHSLEDLLGISERLGFRIVHLQENQGFGVAWMEKSRGEAADVRLMAYRQVNQVTHGRIACSVAIPDFARSIFCV